MSAIFLRNLAKKKILLIWIIILIIMSSIKNTDIYSIPFHMWILSSPIFVKDEFRTYPVSLKKQMIAVLGIDVMILFFGLLVISILTFTNVISFYKAFYAFAGLCLIVVYDAHTVFQFSKVSGVQWATIALSVIMALVIYGKQNFYPLEKFVYIGIVFLVYMSINMTMIYLRERNHYYVEH